MNKLYFVETNGGYMTVATSDDGRACYMWQDGMEENYPSSSPYWDESEASERKTIAENWLRSIAEWNSFDDLYANCDTSSGFTGVYTAAEFSEDLENGSSIIAEIDF